MNEIEILMAAREIINKALALENGKARSDRDRNKQRRMGEMLLRLDEFIGDIERQEKQRGE